MLKIFKKLFDTEYKELKRFNQIATQIDALDEEYSKLSDKKLAKKEKREIWAKDKNRKEKMQMYDKAFDDYRRGRKGIYKD